MPPQLALFACIGFVFCLLRVERRAAPEVSAALWIPTIWMLTTNSKSLAIWFGVSASNESGSPLDQVLLLSLAGAAAIVLNSRRLRLAGSLHRNAALIALLACMFVGTLWADPISVALRRWLREVIVLVMALAIISEERPREAVEALLRRSAYILLPFSLLLIKYFPHLGVQYSRWEGNEMWTGVTFHKNALGALAMVCVLFLLWALYRYWHTSADGAIRYRRWADMSVLFIALFILKGAEGAYSASAIGTLALSITAFLVLLWLRNIEVRISRGALLALVVILIGFGVSAPFSEGSSIAVFSSSLGRDATLTGRTQVWAQLVPVFERNSLLGYGFGSFWTDARQELYQINFGHNGYLDILLELGVVGLVFFVVWLLSCAWKFHRALTDDYEWGSLAICFLVVVIIYNSAESALNSLTGGMTAVLAVLSAIPNLRPSNGSR